MFAQFAGSWRASWDHFADRNKGKLNGNDQFWALGFLAHFLSFESFVEKWEARWRAMKDCRNSRMETDGSKAGVRRNDHMGGWMDGRTDGRMIGKEDG